MEAIPKFWFSWNFNVLEGSIPVADIDMSWWREKASLTIQGRPYTVYREGLMSGAFILENEEGVVARASKPSAFRDSFDVEHSGREYKLSYAHGREFLFLENRRKVGSVARTRMLSRRTDVDLPEDLPLPVKVFVVWLALILWKRESDSAVGAVLAVAGS
ncbi:MAG TPA: hypothetical protein VF173_24800 [Thermoanaerobaculia bacterium]|nr:hypothetical protein [Thermoanaerobaculia bacterium]